MIVYRISRIAAAVLSSFVAVNTIVASSESSRGSPEKSTCSISVPFTVKDKKGWIPDGTVFSVKLSAQGDAPLPEKTLYTVDVSGSFEFGPIIFDEPDNYEYTISEVAYDDNNIIFDSTVYQLAGNWKKEIETATSATTYTAAAMTTANNVTSLTGAQLNGGYTFYLSDGEYVKVKGLEVNGTTPVTYTISEEAEDYNSTATIAATVAEYGDIAHTDAVSGNIVADKDVYTGFVNDRTGAIPTGVILSVAGPAVVGIGAVGLLITLNAKKRREDNEE